MGRLARRLSAFFGEESILDIRSLRGDMDPRIREHMETIGKSFLEGFHAALEDDESPEGLALRLEAIEQPYRGFAHEGTAMALFLLDRLLPWRRNFEPFFDGPGKPHIYMAFVGAGWAMARLPFGFRRSFARVRRLHPLYCWLALDGFGCHHGLFHWPTSVQGPQAVPRQLRGYARRAFDQGLGRSLWFVVGGDVARAAGTVAAFPPSRQSDLWAGLGLAATYAGGVGEEDLQHLAGLAGEAGHATALFQGAVFAAETRRSAGNVVPRTELASRIFTGLPAEDAADIAIRAREDLPPDSSELPAFEVWRGRIRERAARAVDEGEPVSGSAWAE